MLTFIVIIIIFFSIYFFSLIYLGSKSTSRPFEILLQPFRNVTKIYRDYSITIYQADACGENFLFAFKNNHTQFTLNDINILYEKAIKFHFHNRILISASNTYPTYIQTKIQEYEIDIWNREKLISILKNDSSYTSSILKTSDTSDDTCEIDPDQNDPIQDGKFNTNSLLSIFGNKPNRL